MSSPFTDHYISYSETPNDNTQVSSPFYRTFRSLLDDGDTISSPSPSLIRAPQPLFDNEHLNFTLDQAFHPHLLERVDTNESLEETKYHKEHNAINSRSRAIKKFSQPARTSLVMTGSDMAQAAKRKRAKRGCADPEQRAIRNRMSAQRSLENKKNRIKELEATCSKMAEENKKLLAEKSGMSVAFRNLMVAYNQLSRNLQASQLHQGN